MFQTAIDNTSILLVCIAIGFIAKRSGIIKSEDTSVLTTIVLNITVPALLIMSMQREFDASVFTSSLLVFAILIMIQIVSLLLALPLTKLLKSEGGEKAILMLVMGFSNTTFMGVPIIYAMLGEQALMYAAMGTMANKIMLFSVGIAIVIGGRTHINIKSVLFNRFMLAIYVGLLLFVFSVRLPVILTGGLTMVGSMTTPLAMITIGVILADNKLKSVFFGWKMHVAILFRLIILPLAVFFTFRMIISNELVVLVLTIITAMPAAANTAIFASQYNKEPLLASKTVFVSTVLCLITIPIIVMITELF